MLTDSEKQDLLMYYVHEALRLDSEVEFAESQYLVNKTVNAVDRLHMAVLRRSIFDRVMRDVFRLLHI